MDTGAKLNVLRSTTANQGGILGQAINAAQAQSQGCGFTSAMSEFTSAMAEFTSAMPSAEFTSAMPSAEFTSALPRS